MNRRKHRHAQRRMARVRVRNSGVSIDAVRCADCNSTVALTELAPGIYRGVVEHDPSCPWLAELERDLLR